MERIFLLFIYVVTLSAQNWQQLSDYPGCRYDGVAFVIGEDIYYGLGILCGGSESKQFFRFDAGSNTWSQIADFPGDSRRMATAFSINGKGYVGLGFSNGISKNDFWEYDPVNDSWQSIANYPGSPRGNVVADVVNNKAYVGGGLSPTGNNLYPTDFYEYDPDSNQWSAVASFPNIILFRAESFVIGDTMYVIGGYDSSLVVHSQVWAYSAPNNTWTQLNDFPGDARLKGTTFVSGNTAYYGYGFNGFTYYDDFYKYDPAMDTWTQIPSIGMGGILFDASGTTTLGHGYCISGIPQNTSSPPSTSLWQYIPSTTNIYNAGKKVPQVFLSQKNRTLNIKCSEKETFSVKNLFGQTLHEIKVVVPNRTYVLSTRNFPEGIYFLVPSSSSYKPVKFLIKH